MDTFGKNSRNGNLSILRNLAIALSYHIFQLITEGATVSYIPRLLAVYPVIPNSLQLREFANIWKSYGSVKQLQVWLTFKHMTSYAP